MQDFEQLGAFYLGKHFDLAQGQVTEDLVMYDAKDLTTHAVIVGMTGSGKTGLGIGLIEEAAIDGVPSIVIDPKGDLGNLMLTFPGLNAREFRPWIDEAEAQKKGLTPDAYAEETAARWKKGIAAWGQDATRIERLRSSATAVLYTPGSSAGVPLTLLRSFAAPPEATRGDTEALRERVTSTTSGLLALLGIDADPVKSREHILLANILENSWRNGQDVDIPALIRAIQQPPFDQLGVFDLETFYPKKERFELAMALNGLCAAPGFAAWTQGEPLDVQRLLWGKDGKPKIAIVSVAHLSDAERMFFVTALLNEVVAWMRQQSGTGSLRAMLYMDEVFGYLPPSKNPPSKLPLLTLLKQARAFGLGVVLATQNPVDLDYKALGNAGTWFLGRLQTERDKLRIVDGLEGASAASQSFDRARLEATISGLQPRTFLMVNAHDDQPTLFQTRWTLSYLRGPLTRPQIQALSQAGAVKPSAVPYGVRTDPPAVPSVTLAPRAAAENLASRPMLPPDVQEVFLPLRTPLQGARLEYRPQILGTARVHFADAKSGIDLWQTLVMRAPVPDDGNLDPWEGALVSEESNPKIDREPQAGATFALLSGAATKSKNYGAWQKALQEWLYRTRSVQCFRCADLKLTSTSGEDESTFRSRIAQTAREQRDLEVEGLRQKYAGKLQAAQDRVRNAQNKVSVERSQASQSKLGAALSVGVSILGAIFGSKKAVSAVNIGRAATAARSLGKTAKESGDVARAEESVEVLQQRLQELESALQAEVDALKQDVDASSLQVSATELRPKKTDTTVGQVVLAWAPFQIGPLGQAEPAG